MLCSALGWEATSFILSATVGFKGRLNFRLQNENMGTAQGRKRSRVEFYSDIEEEGVCGVRSVQKSVCVCLRELEMVATVCV